MTIEVRKAGGTRVTILLSVHLDSQVPLVDRQRGTAARILGKFLCSRLTGPGVNQQISSIAVDLLQALLCQCRVDHGLDFLAGEVINRPYILNSHPLVRLELGKVGGIINRIVDSLA